MSPRPFRRDAGQLVFAGFAGPVVTPEIRAIAREYTLGGIVLFKRNVEEPAQVAELAYDIAQLQPDLPLWVAVDQEGGRVARMRAPFTEWPPMLTLGRSGDPALAGRFARALAAELAAVGVTLDFAPVLDVLTNPSNPVIGDRALAEDAERVAELGTVVITALQDAGIAACGKHFPGHGDTSVDSHVELPLVEHPVEQLRAREFVPFRAAIAAGVASIMTGHVFMPALDETVPATLSSRVVTGLLRRELGYDGLVFTDDLEMKAISAHHSVPGAAVQAVAAGCDAVLVCGTDHDVQAQAIEALIHAVEDETISRTRIDEALGHHRVARHRFLPAVPRRPRTARELRALLGTGEHQLVADEMRRFA